MITCNVIFWSVIVPIMSFGCEVWVLSEKDKENILAFQRFAGRRIQRFPHRSLNHTSFYGLGWVKLTTFILVKANMYNSPVFDILNAAFRMGLLNTVYGMINGSIQVYSKKAWSEYVWSQARKLEDAFWQSTFVLKPKL